MSKNELQSVSINVNGPIVADVHHFKHSEHLLPWSSLYIDDVRFLSVTESVVRSLRDKLTEILQAWPDSHKLHCPTCQSPARDLHPANGLAGEAQQCRDRWHNLPVDAMLPTIQTLEVTA